MKEQKVINIYTIQQLKIVNKDAFYKVIDEAKTDIKNSVTNCFDNLYKDLGKILFLNGITDIKSLKGKALDLDTKLRIIEDLKNVDYFNDIIRWQYVQDFLNTYPLKDDIINYLMDLFHFLSKQKKNEYDKYQLNDIINYIDLIDTRFTINGIDIDTL